MSLKEVTKVIHFIVCLYRLLSPKLLISDDKDAFLLFSWHGEGTFHMKDLFPAFREAERRVKISFLHWPFLRNFNSKQNAIEACFGMVYLGLQQHPDLDFYIALSNNASGFLKKWLIPWHEQRKYLMNLESGNSRKKKVLKKQKYLPKGSI